MANQGNRNLARGIAEGLIVGGAVLLIAGCGSADRSSTVDSPAGDSVLGGTSSTAGQDDIDVNAPRRPTAFYEMDVGGHLIQFIEPVSTALIVAERAPIDESGLLDGVDIKHSTASEIYSRLRPNAPIPAEIVDYDARSLKNTAATMSLPDKEVASSTGEPTPALPGVPGPQILHEAGGPHFQTAHCPTTPDSSSEFYFYEEHAPISVRTFCWAAGFTGNWTESASAKVLQHTVSAAVGSVSYTMGLQGFSGSWDVLQGQQWLFNGRNGLFWDCWCVPICACGDQDINQTGLSGAITNAAGDTWRFGGGMWR